MPKVLLVMNASSHFAVVWIRQYLRHGWSIDLLSANSLKKNIHLESYVGSLSNSRNPSSVLRVINPRIRKKTGLLPVILSYITLIGLLLTTRFGSEKYDAVHAHYLVHHGLLCALILGSSRLVVSPYGSDVYADLSKPLARLYPLIFKRCSLVLVTSKQLAITLIQMYPYLRNKIVVESWGIDIEVLSGLNKELPEEFDQSLIGNYTFLISYRSVTPIYQTNFIIDIFEKLLERTTRLHLILATNASTARAYVKKVLKRINESDMLRNHVTFIDRALTHSEIKGLVTLADYSFSTPIYDQLSSTLLECMYLHTIPIISDLQAYNPIRNHGNVLVVRKNDPASILDEFLDLQSNEDERNRWQKENRMLIENKFESNFLFNRIIGNVEKTISM
jgi:glycosyltransferase involved in cell wall biosynthesis